MVAHQPKIQRCAPFERYAFPLVPWNSGRFVPRESSPSACLCTSGALLVGNPEAGFRAHVCMHMDN
jgi:hypothetical protein